MTNRETIIARAESLHAHHEAGHAVAAVARGGYLKQVKLGVADWSSDDDSDDTPGYTRHVTEPTNQPFVTYAGPWASAMWLMEHDPEVTDFDDAIEFAWSESFDGDAVKYGGVVDQLNEAARQLGLTPIAAAWESDWHDELMELWPVIRTVADALLTGQLGDAGPHEYVRAVLAAGGAA